MKKVNPHDIGNATNSNIVQELKLRKVNHEMGILNSINDIILESKDETELFNLVSYCLIKYGGYKLVWFSNIASDADKYSEIRRIAAYGETRYLDEIRVDMNETKDRQGPAIKALTHGEIIVTNNISSSNHFAPWSAVANKYNILSAIVVPFTVGNERYGLNIYSEKLDAFDEHEQGIIQRSAKNVALALLRFREREQKENYNFLLKERIKELKTLSTISDILQTERNLEHALQKIADVIPGGWQFPEYCYAMIRYNGQIYESPDLGPLYISMEESICLNNGVMVSISISYTEGKPETADAVFFDEEKELLRQILKVIRLYINKKLAMEELILSESNLNTVFENTDVGNLLLDLNGRIVTFNTNFKIGYYKLTHKRAEKGMVFYDLLLEQKIINFKTRFNQVAVRGIPASYETIYRFKDDDKYYMVTILPVKSPDGKIVNVSLTIKDVTQSRNQELEQINTTNDLIERNRDLEQFSFLVSHNLRAPVHNVIGLSEQLQKDLPAGEKQFVLKAIMNTTQKIETVINDINAIVALNKSVKKEKERIDLRLLFQDQAEYFTQMFAKSPPLFTIDVSAVSEVKSYRTYLESIVYNLISNSVKYAKPGTAPEINIVTERKDNDWGIRMRDNGIGIDLEKYGGEIFKLYHRINHSVEGRGMGLFMVREQVKILGGEIFVNSKPGEGAEFFISFKAI